MKKIYQTLGVMSVTFLLASCSNNTQNGSEDIVNSDEVVEQMDESTESATDTVEESEDTEDSASADSTVEENQEHQMTLKLGYGAPHGERSFSAIFVGLEGDTITNVSIDEFQFMDASEDYQGVPNSDNDFGEGYDENQILISKVENNEAYSKLMAEKAEATNSLVEGYQAISEFAEGKTISELEEAIDDLHQ